MRRADLLAAIAIAALALGGCMRIYPDPELPDVEASWFDGDCELATGGNVVLTMIGVDDPTSRTDLTVPCADLKATFADLAREQYRLEASLQDPSGQLFGTNQTDVDLRDGLDERAYLYFGTFSNLRLFWTFDMGATCASLAAEEVLIEFSIDGMSPSFGFTAPCEESFFFGSAPAGVYTLRARALAASETVAISPESAPVTIVDFGFTDAGTLTMTPCAPTCP